MVETSVGSKPRRDGILTILPNTNRRVKQRCLLDFIKRLNDFVRMADSERRWRNIVHIGIGGSDWGVRLAVSAFGYAGTWREVHFVANIDGHAIQGGLSGLDPHDTLIVMASKSFTTAETLQNGQRALEWLQAAGVDVLARGLVAHLVGPRRAPLRRWARTPRRGSRPRPTRG